MNQCDGCNRNLPLLNKLHWDGDKPVMYCQKEKYCSCPEIVVSLDGMCDNCRNECQEDFNIDKNQEKV